MTQDKNVIMYDSKGNPVTAWSLVTEITVSLGVKTSDGNFGSTGPMMSIRAAVPENARDEQTIDRLANIFFAKLEETVNARLTGSAVEEPEQKPAPQPNKPTPLAPPPAVNEGRNLGLLQNKPKASDSQPYDVYQVMVDEYAFDGAEVRFYREGMKYPDASMRLNEKTEGLFAEVFGDWKPTQTETGKHLPIVANRKVTLTIQCTGPDRVTSKGNPYHNIIKAESVPVAKAA
jgi:hypothetical protein